MTLGYDPHGRPLCRHLGRLDDDQVSWVYKGWIEPDGRTLTLEAEGPDFTDPTKTAIYRDAITFVDEDTRRFTASVRQPDGSFHTFMTSEMQRQS